MTGHPVRATALRVGLVLAAVCSAVVAPAEAGEARSVRGHRVRLEPGPRTITEAERAVARDPARGIEHGVILEREAILVEDGKPARYGIRQRAKVLSDEARGLGEIVIPLKAPQVRLSEFWAFAILPDGTVNELRREDLVEQFEIESRSGEARSLRGSIPDVVPGTVVEFGWEILAYTLYDFEVRIADRWPVEHFRSTWVPVRNGRAAYVFLGRTRAAFDVDSDRGALIVEGRGIEPVVDEPYAPPMPRRALRLVTYYRGDATTDPDTFWKNRAKARRAFLKEFARGRKEIDRAIAGMDIPEQASLEDRLRIAYDWIQRHIENVDRRSWTRRDAVGADEKPVRDGARWVLAERRGTSWQIRWTYAAIAQRLGADVRPLFVVDRRWGEFVPGWLSMDQFDGAIVLLGIAGGAEAKQLAVDPAYPLPFGRIPWWFAGTSGLVLSGEVCAAGRLDPERAEQNVMTVAVRLRADLEAGVVLADWTREGTGQFRLARSAWRRVRPARLEESLAHSCGASDTVEVLEASAPQLEEPLAPFRLACRSEHLVEPPDAGTAEWAFPLDGPWLDAAPDIGTPPRRTPVEFAFPARRVLTLTIEAPPGFEPVQAAAPVAFASEFGRYRLACVPVEHALRCQRERTLERDRIPLGEVSKFREFLARISEADRLLLKFARTEDGS
ncbi:MAG: hypothetical protein Kow0062_09250 [Acidobacteriota bacterium]